MMDTQDMPAWPPSMDVDGTRFGEQLQVLYAGDHGAHAGGPVDILGWVRWGSDYRFLRALGLSHEQAWDTIKAEILRIWAASPVIPPAGPHPDPIVGALKIENRTFADASGPRLPVFVHAGDLIGQALKFGLPRVLPALDAFAAAGYHGVRSWINVERHWWWANKPVPSWNLLDDREGFRAVLEAGAARGLRWHLASGGLCSEVERGRRVAMPASRQRQMFDAVADAIGQVGPEYFALIEACNECRDTTTDGHEAPSHLASLVARVRSRYPDILTALSAYTGTEERDVMQRYTPDSQRFGYCHGYRGGRAHDKIRHIFSWVYEVMAKRSDDPWVRELGWQGEPFGPGRLVSAMDGHGELDAGVMGLAACQAAMARQVWTLMSGPGVVLSDEPLTSMPGFALTPALVRQLPRDLMTFATLSHSGKSKRGQRIHAVDEDHRPDVRADYAIAADGRYVEVTYGPPDQIARGPLAQERPTRDVQRIHSCAWGYVDVGRVQ